MTIYRRSDPIPNDATRRPQVAGLKRESLDRAAARVIYEGIVVGKYPEGSIIPREADLVTDLGVSRTALREAIKGLVAKGLLQTRRRTGTRVRDRSEWNLLDLDVMEWTRGHTAPDAIAADLSALLAALDPLAATLAAHSHRSPDLETLGERLADLISSWTNQDQRVAGIAGLHGAIAGASGNRYLHSIIGAVYGDLLRNDPTYLRRRSDGRSELYVKLVDAIRASNAESAGDLMRRLATLQVKVEL